MLRQQTSRLLERRAVFINMCFHPTAVSQLHQHTLQTRILSRRCTSRFEEGRALSTGFATVVTSALVLPLVHGPTRPIFRRDCVRILSWQLCCAISRGRASSTGFATAERSALVVPLVLDQQGPSSPGGTASSDSVMALCFGGQASPADFATAVTLALVVAFPSGAKKTQLQKTLRLRILCFAIPRVRGFPSAVAAALTMSFAPGPEDPASPEDSANSTICSTMRPGMRSLRLTLILSRFFIAIC